MSDTKRKRDSLPPAEARTSMAGQVSEAGAPLAPSQVSPRIDGRSLRKTGRTVQFATRVSADFDQRFREVAKRDGLLFARLLELSLEAYEKKN
jgi:hypothetical protein